MDMTWNRQNGLGIQFYHSPLLVFTVDGEEVQKLSDMLLALVKVAFIAGCLRDQIVSELLKNGKSPGRIKVYNGLTI